MLCASLEHVCPQIQFYHYQIIISNSQIFYSNIYHDHEMNICTHIYVICLSVNVDLFIVLTMAETEINIQRKKWRQQENDKLKYMDCQSAEENRNGMLWDDWNVAFIILCFSLYILYYITNVCRERGKKREELSFMNKFIHNNFFCAHKNGWS